VPFQVKMKPAFALRLRCKVLSMNDRHQLDSESQILTLGFPLLASQNWPKVRSGLHTTWLVFVKGSH